MNDYEKIPTQQKLVEVASRLFWEKSYQSVSVDAICQEASVKKGSFYHFYRSKEDIALVVLDYLWLNTKEQDLDPVLEDVTLTPLKKLHKIIDFCQQRSCEIHGESPKFQGCPFGNLALELGTQKEKVRQHIANIFKEYYTLFRGIFDEALAKGELKEGVDPHYATRIFLSCMEGSCVVAKTYNDSQLIADNLQQFLAMITAD